MAEEMELTALEQPLDEPLEQQEQPRNSKRKRVARVKETKKTEPVEIPNFTEQQRLIIDTALQGKNVQIFAMAGTGKTSVSLQVARELHEVHGKRTLLLSYNKGLQTDTQKRAKKLGLGPYLDIRTIHSALAFYTKRRCSNTLELQQAVDVGVFQTPINFDTLIIDEAQDVTPLLYQACCLLIKYAVEQQSTVQVLIMGDILQRVYGFQGARSEYLMYPNLYFSNKFHLQTFTMCRMSINFRCSKKILDYVNRICNIEQFKESELYKPWFLEHEEVLMTAWGAGFEACEKAIEEQDLYPDVIEVVGNYSDAVEVLRNQLKEHYNQGHEDSDICILVNSEKPHTPLMKNVVLRLGKFKNFHFQTENKSYNPRLLKNKIGVSTYCGFKGRERHHMKVFPPGRWIEKETLKGRSGTGLADPSSVYNCLYVALTRGIKSMTVFWCDGQPSFINGILPCEGSNENTPLVIGVHALCYRANELYAPLQPQNLFSQQTLTLADAKVFDTQDDRIFSGRYFSKEDYSPVIGLAVEYGVAYGLGLLQVKPIVLSIANTFAKKWCRCVEHEEHKGQPCETHQNVCCSEFSCCNTQCKCCNYLCEHIWSRFKNKLMEQPPVQLNWDDFLQLALYSYCVSLQNFQLLRQMVGLHEISREQLQLCKEQAEEFIRSLPGTVSYHNLLSKDVENGSVRGESDFIVDRTVVELKITSDVTTEYMTQTVLYNALHNSGAPLPPCYVLAPNLGLAVQVTPLPTLSDRYILTHALIRHTQKF